MNMTRDTVTSNGPTKGDVVYFPDKDGVVQKVPVQESKPMTHAEIEETRVMIKEQLTDPAKSKLTAPQLNATIYTVRVNEIRNSLGGTFEQAKKLADEELDNARDLAERHPWVKETLETIYTKMERDAQKLPAKKIPGLTVNGATYAEKDFAAGVLYIVLEDLRDNRGSNRDTANDANLALTSKNPEESLQALDRLAKAGMDALATQPQLTNVDAYNTKISDDNENAVTALAAVVSKAFSGRRLVHNAGVTIHVLQKEPFKSAYDDAAPATEPKPEEVDKDTKKEGTTPPPVDTAEPPKNEKKADTEHGRLLRLGYKVALAIAAVRAVKAANRESENLIRKAQGEKADNTKEWIFRKVGVTAATVTTATAAYLGLKYANEKIDSADYRKLRNSTYALIGSLAVVYVGNRLYRTYQRRNGNMTEESMFNAAGRYMRTFFRKVEKNAEAADRTAPGVEKTKNKASSRLVKIVAVIDLLGKVEGSSNKIEKQVQKAVNALEFLSFIPQVKAATDKVKAAGNKAEHVASRIEAPASMLKNTLEAVVEAAEEDTISGVMRVVWQNVVQYFWETPEETAARRAESAANTLQRETTIEAQAAMRQTLAQIRGIQVEELATMSNTDVVASLREELNRLAGEQEPEGQTIATPQVAVPEVAEVPAGPVLQPITLDQYFDIEGVGSLVFDIARGQLPMQRLDQELAANGLRMSEELFNFLAQGQLKDQLADLQWDTTTNQAIKKTATV